MELILQSAKRNSTLRLAAVKHAFPTHLLLVWEPELRSGFSIIQSCYKGPETALNNCYLFRFSFSLPHTRLLSQPVTMHSAICSFCCIRFSNGVNRFCARSKNNVSLLKHLCLLFCRTFCLTGAWQPYHTTSRNNGQLNTLQNTEQWFWWKIASHRSSIERVTLFGKPQRTLGCASLRMFEPRLSLGANLSCSAFRVRVRLGSKQYKRTKKKNAQTRVTTESGLWGRETSEKQTAWE